jgi:uncharacterized protein YecA (UPF0149 family)
MGEVEEYLADMGLHIEDGGDEIIETIDKIAMEALQEAMIKYEL